MRIAFFGGSFDPPHLGHARIAREAADRLRLDRVLFAPAGLQPLKRKNAPPVPFRTRLEMLQAMLADPSSADPRFETSDVDAPLPGERANYTYETLQRLKQHLSPADELFVLLGADSLLTLPHWHRARELLHSASWIVAARPGFPFPELKKALLEVTQPSIIEEPSQAWSSVLHVTLNPADPPGRPVQIYLLPNLSEEASATAIRTQLATSGEGETMDLAPSVHQYILTHGLYRPAGSSI